MTDKKDFADSIRQKLEDWDYQLDRLTARLGDKRDEWRAVSRSSCCLLYTSPSPRDKRQSRMPSSA